MSDIDLPTPLLGGLSPAQFMRRHWHRKPLLVRQAWPQARPPIDHAGLFELAGRDDVESRLVVRDGERWRLRRGPLPRRSLPARARPGWTLLVQGLDLHVDAAHALLSRFRFAPDARLDDLMVSYASEGGGVGPHTDSYDVFLMQVAGCRRWRIGRCPHPRWRDDVPLKMLASFTVEQDWVLEPGDMLYLPPHWAHDGVAVGGDCMTASIGFRAPQADELAAALLARMAEAPMAAARRYRDVGQVATGQPGAVPATLQDFARSAVARSVTAPGAIDRALGEWLTEPKAQVWFDAGSPRPAGRAVALAADRRTRMAYDDRDFFINGESYRCSGRDAAVMRRLADRRRLEAAELSRLQGPAADLVDDWVRSGWLHWEPTHDDPRP